MKSSTFWGLQAGAALISMVICAFSGGPANTVLFLGILAYVGATGSSILKEIEKGAKSDE